MKKRYTTYGTLCKLPLGGSLWGLLFFFIFTACQDEIPNDTTEVMMTFTTRAMVTQNNESDAIEIEKMKDLRVIMVRENGTVVHNHKVENITTSSVTITFQTPVKTGGENFQFFAIANEGSLKNGVPDDYTQMAKHIVGDGNNMSFESAIPQTKHWTHKVEQKQSQSISQSLEYIASKISVQFINNTNAEQSLSNIKITGIPLATQGYLFEQEDNDFVGTQQGASEEITFDDVTNIAANGSSAIQHYYTYPVDGITDAKLSATWGEETKTLSLGDITSLPRNQHLKIIVTLTGPDELTVNYTIAPWEELATNIGGTSPTPEGGYDVKDWFGGNDVVIGEEQGGGSGGGEEPEPEPDDPPSGETSEVEVWSGSQVINWSSNNQYLAVQLSWLENATTVTGPNDLSGIQMYVYYTGTGDMQVRQGNNDNNQYGELYLNGNKNGYLGGLNGEKVSVFIPDEVKNTPFTFSGQNYTITKITVVK